MSIVVALALTAGACSSDDPSAEPSGSSTTMTAPQTTKPENTAQTPGSAPQASNSPSTTEPAVSATTTTDGITTTTTARDQTTDTSTPTTSVALAVTEAERADRELARTALVTLDAFPEGWVEEPDANTVDTDTEEFEAEFRACLGRSDAERVRDDLQELAVSTGDFHPDGDDATTVTHEVVLAPDETTAITAMSEVAVDGAEPCLAQVIRRFYISSFADDPDLADVGVGEVIVTRTESDQDRAAAVGVLLEVPLTLGDQTVSQFLEVLYQRHGRALSELSFSSFGSPFSRDGYGVLSDDVGARLTSIGG
jgi:hypothetical protein